jgi:hypothetical protein
VTGFGQRISCGGRCFTVLALSLSLSLSLFKSLINKNVDIGTKEPWFLKEIPLKIKLKWKMWAEGKLGRKEFSM